MKSKVLLVGKRIFWKKDYNDEDWISFCNILLKDLIILSSRERALEIARITIYGDGTIEILDERSVKNKCLA